MEPSTGEYIADGVLTVERELRGDLLSDGSAATPGGESTLVPCRSTTAVSFLRPTSSLRDASTAVSYTLQLYTTRYTGYSCTVTQRLQDLVGSSRILHFLSVV